MRKVKYVFLALAWFFAVSICAGPWFFPSTSQLQMLLSHGASIVLALGLVMWLFRRRGLGSLVERVAGVALNTWTTALLFGAIVVLGFGTMALSMSVRDSDLRAKGFVSYDAFLAAAAVGANSRDEYQRYLEKVAAAAEQARRRKLAAAAAEQARRDAAASRDAALERLVIGRWVLPIDKAGEVVTIRKTGSGYEALVQFEGGSSMTYRLKRVGQRFSTNDDFGSHFRILKDGRLQLGDREGPGDTLEILKGRPRSQSEVDAAIQAAFTHAQDVREEERCRKDAICWGDRFRLEAIPLCVAAIENSARYDYRWTNGWLEEKFVPGALWHGRHGQKLGQVDYIGDKLMLQNGFGAWQNVIYACSFDTRLGLPIDLSSRPGHLPGP